MGLTMPWVFHEEGWLEIKKQIVESVLVPRMQRVAEASNTEAGIEDGYRVGTEGDPEKQLRLHDWRSTVITATAEAMVDSARNNTLVNNFHLAGGEE